MSDLSVEEIEAMVGGWYEDDTVRRMSSQLLREIEARERLEAFLHSRTMHPDYEYETTEGQRKAFDESPPEGDGWKRNTHRGRNGWERFNYHEEAYWLRARLDTHAEPSGPDASGDTDSAGRVGIAPQVVEPRQAQPGQSGGGSPSCETCGGEGFVVNDALSKSCADQYEPCPACRPGEGR